MVRVRGHIMQWRTVVKVVGIIVKTPLTTLRQFTRWMMYVRQLHDFDSIFSVEIVHGTGPHVTPRYRRGWRSASHSATRHRWKWFIRTLRITRRAEAMEACWASIWHCGMWHDTRPI